MAGTRRSLTLGDVAGTRRSVASLGMTSKNGYCTGWVRGGGGGNHLFQMFFSDEKYMNEPNLNCQLGGTGGVFKGHISIFDVFH